MISLVVAAARNGVIGKDGALPWRLPSDLKRFRTLTMGKPVIMGRKTWESLPEQVRPLPGRLNIVLTRQPGYVASGAVVAATLEESLRLAADATEIMVIGGGDIYRLFIDRAERIHLTEVDAEPDGDTWFMPLDPAIWREIATEHPERGPKDSAGCVLRSFERVGVRGLPTSEIR